MSNNEKYNSNEYNSNEYNSNEYSPETRKEIRKEILRQKSHPYDKDPIDYPFHNLKSELSIYNTEFKLPNFDPITMNFYTRLDHHYDKNHIDEPTYHYIRSLHELKVKLMYPIFTETRFQKKITLPDLIKKLDELIRLFHQMNLPFKNIDSLWMYYSEKEKNDKITLFDFVVSLYKYYNEEDIPKRLRKFTEHSKKVIEEFIHYLIVNGSNIKNLKKVIDHKTLSNSHLYHVIFRGLLNKNTKKFINLKNYTNHYKSIKRKINKELNTNALTRVLNSLPKNVHKSVKSYL